MTLVRCKPRHNLLNVSNDFENLFNGFLNLNLSHRDSFNNKTPLVDIEETDNDYRIVVDLPGMKKEEINLTVKDNELTISGEKKEEKEKKDRNYHRLERRHGKFSRSFSFENDVLHDKIDANFKHGVLSIVLPKAEEVKPKEIEVKVN